jgi:hypothetical protein
MSNGFSLFLFLVHAVTRFSALAFTVVYSLRKTPQLKDFLDNLKRLLSFKCFKLARRLGTKRQQLGYTT